MLNAIESIPHTDPAVHDGKDFLTVVGVPLVRLVRPMQPDADAVHRGN
jgi:hypothetical protein